MTSVPDAPPRVPLQDLRPGIEDVREHVLALWESILDTAGFVGGPIVQEFEAGWAAYCGTEHAIGVANGTDALELVLRGLGIGAGAEVIVPANTFVATVEAIVVAGATPRFVDVDPESLLITGRAVREAANDRTAAVVVVPLWGNVPDMDDLAAVACSLGVALIEDAAQAQGAAWNGRRAGSFGVAGCFSYYPTKNLGAFGDAGAVVTDDPSLAAAIRSIANHGRTPEASHLHVRLARNSRLDALQAAVLVAKLAHLDRWNDGRRRVAQRYREYFPPGGSVSWVEAPHGSTSVHHQAVVRVQGRDSVRRALDARGIQTGVHYPMPCHQQDPYRDYATEPLPVAERAAGEILSLPIYEGMPDEVVDRAAEALLEVTAVDE